MKRLETKSFNRSSPPPPPTLNHFLSNKLENFCLGHFSISIALLSLFLVNTLALSAPGEHALLCILVAGKDAVWGEDAP